MEFNARCSKNSLIHMCISIAALLLVSSRPWIIAAENDRTPRFSFGKKSYSLYWALSPILRAFFFFCLRLFPFSCLILPLPYLFYIFVRIFSRTSNRRNVKKIEYLSLYMFLTVASFCRGRAAICILHRPQSRRKYFLYGPQTGHFFRPQALFFSPLGHKLETATALHRWVSATTRICGGSCASQNLVMSLWFFEFKFLTDRISDFCKRK